MAAPVKKADAQRRNRPARLEVVAEVAPVLPAAPKRWLKATRDAYAAYADSDVARLVDAAADWPSLVELFDMYEESERAKRMMRKSGRYAEGSTGQVVAAPWFKAWQDMQKMLRPLEDRFGVTPRGRLNLGIKLGDAAASIERLNELAASSSEEGGGEDFREVLDL